MRAVLAAGLLLASAASGPADAQPSLRGRIHVDAARSDEDVAPLNDSIRVRRARIGVRGSYEEAWSYLAEVDFAEDEVDIKDLWLAHGDIAGGRLQVGQFKVPFSLEQLTSSNDITFLERSQADMFAPARRLGIGWSRRAARHTFSVMGFGQEAGTDREGGDDGFGAAARATFLPLLDERGYLHVGIAVASYEPAHSGNEVMRFRQRPESRPASTRLIDTGVIDSVESTRSLGLEAAWTRGPLSLQGEYMSSRVRRSGLPSPTFDAWYVYASYVLTGESRPYAEGVIRSPVSSDGRGAWELALRYSEGDLDDGAIAGGVMENVTFGVNWYLRSNVRFMFNYVDVSSTRAGVDDDPSILQLRAQVTF